MEKEEPEPLNAAIFACATTCFYTAARLGEFTVPTLSSFDPQAHVKPANITLSHNQEELPATTFFLPRMKTAVHSESVSWAAQSGTSDPKRALQVHMRINNPLSEGPLFAYKSKKEKSIPLTKKKFLEVLSKAAKAAGLEPLQGHGIRIGATLEYLLRGVPFEAMKAIGQWSSDAFYGYLSKHEQILAPYLQAVPLLHESFIRLTLAFRK